MDMGFDHEAWPMGHRAASEPAASGSLDWHGLRARFRALQAYRASLATVEVRANRTLQGSFHRAAAHSLATFDASSPGVNPNDLGDGKGLLGNCGDTAGAIAPGDRG